MIIIKSPEEIGLMQQAAVPTREMLANLADIVKPGISTKDINDYVEEYIAKSGQKPAIRVTAVSPPRPACRSMKLSFTGSPPGTGSSKKEIS